MIFHPDSIFSYFIFGVIVPMLSSVVDCKCSDTNHHTFAKSFFLFYLVLIIPILFFLAFNTVVNRPPTPFAANYTDNSFDRTSLVSSLCKSYVLL
jgi:hypothetical protein